MQTYGGKRNASTGQHPTSTARRKQAVKNRHFRVAIRGADIDRAWVREKTWNNRRSLYKTENGSGKEKTVLDQGENLPRRSIPEKSSGKPGHRAYCSLKRMQKDQRNRVGSAIMDSKKKGYRIAAGQFCFKGGRSNQKEREALKKNLKETPPESSHTPLTGLRRQVTRRRNQRLGKNRPAKKP